MTEHNCNYCNRSFSCKTALNRHKFGSCLWIHAAKKEKLSELDSLEPKMTDSQQDALLRQLLYQVALLKNKVVDMQKEISTLKKKQKIKIISILNGESRKPTVFKRWITSISISQLHLELVFRKTLKDGIRQVIIDSIETSKIIDSVIPLRCFVEKPNNLYIFTNIDDEDKWTLSDGNIMRWCYSQIASKFYESFMTWQTENEDYLFSSTESQEQYMLFMQKIMDTSHTKQQIMSELQNSIYDSSKEELNDFEFE